MKYLKLIIICGIGVVAVLTLCFALLHLFRAAEGEEQAVPVISHNMVEINADSETFKIVEVSSDDVTPMPEEEIAAVSDDKAGAVSENGTMSVSGNIEAAVSDNSSEQTASEEADPVSENETPSPTPLPSEPEEDLPEDTGAPFFLSFNGNPTIKIGDAFDIHKYIGYADDVDRYVDLEVSGEVNTAAEGSYPLSITIRDDTGKSASRSMTVKLVSELPGGGGYAGSKEEFSDFRAKYKTENTMVGIDISRWQETVDFEKVRDAGCEFVYMRIGGRDEGELYTDRYYLNNIAGAKAAGLKVGIYWHAEEANAAQVKESVDYLMGVLGGQTLDFPIAYDWEDFLHFENYGMNIHDLNNNLDVFAAEIEARGYSACLYNSKYYLETVWSSAAKHPLWLAHYVNSTTYQGQYFMWQHGCTGRIDGINGDVDLDVYYIQ